MAKSETAQIAQLDERIKSLDANIKQLITDVDAFKDRLSKTNSSGVEQMKKDYQSLQKRIEDLGKSQERTAKSVDEQIQKVSRSRRVDNKILERQNQLLAAQKRLASTGDLGQRFSSLKNSLGSIDFNSILATANAKTGGQKILQESTSGLKKAQQDYKNAVDKTTNSIKQQKSSLESMLPTLRRLASAFGVAFSVQGLVQFGKKLVETRGEFELQQVALRSILQNKQLADEIWDKTMQAALQSPFTAMQLTKYTKQLAAYRIETDKLFDTTKRLADVSAGLGVDMQRLILAYGQVKAANYLRASEIRQFTEAGVNVLGELSNYFSETRGQMYSTAQVMDMVQKRMVKFEDVEEIFKRLTDEGGIFYNMQYVQSQTVWGQLRKLRDAYDQMQNSIGKANEGVIKDFVSILNSAVQNWRGIAVTLKSIGWGVAIGWMSKYALALSGISAASMKTRRSIVSLRQGIEGLGKALKANLPMLAIGAAVALITRFVESARQMKQVNDEIDEQITTLYGASQQMTDYQSTIEKNNALIKSNGKEIADNKKRQEALNDALDSNRGIYSKLKNDYPQIAEQLKQNANGTIENTDALKSYNEQLEREMTLLAMREQKANIGNLWGAFSDSATEDLQDALKNTTKVQTEIRNLQLRLKTDVAKMKASGNVDERQMEYAERLLGIPTEGDIVEAAKRIEEIRSKYVQEFSSREARGDVDVDVFHGAFGSLVDSKIKELDHTIDEFRSEMVNIGWIGEGDNLGKLETDFVGIIENFSGFAKSISDEYSGDVLDFVANNSEIIKKAVEGDAENGIEASPEIVKSIGDALIKAGFATTKEMQSVWNNLLNDRIIFTKKNEELNAIDAQIAAEEAKKIKNRNQQLLDDLRKQREDYIKSHGLDWFAGSSTTGGTNNQSPFDDNNKGKKSASKLISLIREMRSEYDKLSKSAYGYAKSEATVRESYKQSVKEILGKAGITDYDFTTNAGMIAALERVKTYAQKLGPEAAAEVEKYIGQLKTEMTINAQVKIREDFDKEMEKMFSDYELTLDLKKLSLPTGELEGIFDFDLTTIDALRKAVDTFYDEQKRLGADPTDLTKQVEGYYKKIDDMERKALLERLKTYTEYLTQGRDKAVQIHLDELKKMAEIDELYYKRHYSLEQYRGISSQIKRDTEKKLQENEWREFKESDFYTTMFEDLDHVATSSIDLMISELKKLQKNLNNLDPTQVKEIVKAIDNLEKRKRSRSPLKSFVEDFKTMLRWQKERDGYENALAPKLALKDILEERYKRDVLSVAKAEQDYNKLALDGLEGNEAEAKEYWDERLAALNLTKEQLKQVKNEIAEINEKNNEGYGAWVRTYQGVSRGAQYFSEMASAAGTIATEMMDMFDGVEDASKKLASDIADIAGNTAALGGDIAKAIASEGSDVGSMIDGLVRTWNIIKGIFSASEADINRTVERETEKLEILEHSLDRVKRARDRAWDTAKIIESEKETEKAINDMIASYRALIAAEQARKNPDENNIRQWMNEIEQLYEQLEEEREDFIGKFGGIGESGYLSAAEGFVEAWKSAFLETGDGLQGLQDHFDEFLQDWFVKQATMRIASRMLQPMFDAIDKAVDENSDGGVAVTMRELDALREWSDVNFPLISDNLESLAGMFGVGGDGSLSGLAAGIQGITEEQANILEAYWNSVRMYTASIDMNVARIAEMLGVGGANTNPLLQQMSLVAANTQATHQLLQSVTKSGHSQGGYGIKVFND